MDFIEKWKMKLFGRGVQTFKVDEYDENGRVLTLRDAGKNKRRANSIIETWDAKGAELRAPAVNFITSDSLIQPAFITQGGETISLYIRKPNFPNREDVVGKAATFDDITEAMDLNKSMKYLVMGGLFSAPVWWLVFQMLGAFMS